MSKQGLLFSHNDTTVQSIRSTQRFVNKIQEVLKNPVFLAFITWIVVAVLLLIEKMK
ncbi:MAG: hypothetical protein N3A63_03595 [Bacteroidetes bacterium]|nr:hypothetical protein [Bacteroidota bacterium]